VVTKRGGGAWLFLRACAWLLQQESLSRAASRRKHKWRGAPPASHKNKFQVIGWQQAMSFKETLFPDARLSD